MKKRMTWQLMWYNVRAAALNATLQLLVIYKYRSQNDNYLALKTRISTLINSNMPTNYEDCFGPRRLKIKY